MLIRIFFRGLNGSLPEDFIDGEVNGNGYKDVNISQAAFGAAMEKRGEWIGDYLLLWSNVAYIEKLAD